MNTENVKAGLPHIGSKVLPSFLLVSGVFLEPLLLSGWSSLPGAVSSRRAWGEVIFKLYYSQFHSITSYPTTLSWVTCGSSFLFLDLLPVWIWSPSQAKSLLVHPTPSYPKNLRQPIPSYSFSPGLTSLPLPHLGRFLLSVS